MVDITKFTDSPLASFSLLSPNRNSPRNHEIDTITIHCVVGQLSAKRICEVFKPTGRQASCNYAIGFDGEIALCVHERDRSWCSSSSSNDHRAITIEVASDTTHPYAVTDEAFNALVELCYDICKRNGIKKLLWQGDRKLVGQVDKQNMTVHRWFANKACPGDWLYSRHGLIARLVNEKLEAEHEENYVDVKTPFLVRAYDAPIFSGPAQDAKKTRLTTGKGVFTIVEVKYQRGLLKSYSSKKNGWIDLNNVTMLE